MCSLHSFPKQARILKQKQFFSIRKQGSRLFGKQCIVTLSSHPKRQNERPRMGLIVSKKYGKAHERNRFKRIARESFRKLQQQLPKGCDLVISPRSYAKQATSDQLTDELLSLVQQWETISE